MLLPLPVLSKAEAYQVQFFLSRPLLYFCLSFESDAPAWCIFRINESNACFRTSVMTSFSLLMLAYAPLEIIGNACIQSAISTFQYVNEIHIRKNFLSALVRTRPTNAPNLRRAGLVKILHRLGGKESDLHSQLQRLLSYH